MNNPGTPPGGVATFSAGRRGAATAWARGLSRPGNVHRPAALAAMEMATASDCKEMEAFE